MVAPLFRVALLSKPSTLLLSMLTVPFITNPFTSSCAACEARSRLPLKVTLFSTLALVLVTENVPPLATVIVPPMMVSPPWMMMPPAWAFSTPPPVCVSVPAAPPTSMVPVPVPSPLAIIVPVLVMLLARKSSDPVPLPLPPELTIVPVL